MKDIKNRKTTRLQGFDYNRSGAFFLTVCTENRRCVLSKVVGTGVPDGPSIELLPYGKIAEKYIKQLDKKKEKILKKLQTVAEVDTIPKRIDINVNWKKSATWGANPTAESWTNYGYFESSSIGGCGYDKESTATAEVFNQDKSILKLLYIEFEKYLKKNKTMLKHKGNINGREFCEYGCSCYYLPEFDGGVGFNSHRWILEKLGYKCIAESHPRMADTYHFERCKDAKK